jgi:hypothetical protein
MASTGRRAPVVVVQVPGDGVRAMVEALAGWLVAQVDDHVNRRYADSPTASPPGPARAN